MFATIEKPPEVIRYDDGQRCVVLRRAQLSDVAKLTGGVQDSLTELYRFMPWAHFADSNTVEAQTERCKGLIELWDAGQDFSFNLFVHQPDGTLKFAGCVGLHPRCLAKHGMEIGYWVRSDCTGLGLCTLATQMTLLAGFRVMGLQRVQVGCDVANVGSLRVIEKAGFQYEGRQRNMGDLNPSDEVLAKGWAATGQIESYAMIPDDLETLDWPEAIAKHLQFESL